MRKITLLFAIIFTLIGTGCVIGPANLHARPTTHVVVTDAPPHVRHHHATPRTRTTVRINRPNRHDVHHHQRMRPRR